MNKFLISLVIFLSLTVHADRVLIIDISEFAKAPSITTSQSQEIIKEVKQKLGGSFQVAVMNNEEDGSKLFPTKSNIIKQLSSKNSTNKLIYFRTYTRDSQKQTEVFAADSDAKQNATLIKPSDFQSSKASILYIHCANRLSSSEIITFKKSFRKYNGFVFISNAPTYDLGLAEIIASDPNTWKEQVLNLLSTKEIKVSGSLAEISNEDLMNIKTKIINAKKKATDLNAQELAMSSYGSAIMQEKILLRQTQKDKLKEYLSWVKILKSYQQSQFEALNQKSNSSEHKTIIKTLVEYAHPQWEEYEQLVEEKDYLQNQNQYSQAMNALEKSNQFLELIRKDIIDNLEELLSQSSNSASREKIIRKLISLDPSKKLKYAYHGLEFSNQWGMQFVYVRGGQFTMGSSLNEKLRGKDEVQHSVTISKGFYMGIYEVSQKEWQTIMNDSKLGSNAELPVTVNWKDANKFCQKISQASGMKYRLPTEAEWEYACRAGTQTAYSTGEYLNQQYASINQNQATKRQSTKANPWGLYDMHGNVWEWCQDWSWFYEKDAQTDPKGPSEAKAREDEIDMKILRGGSWKDSADNARSANRWENATSYRVPYIGFRVILEPKK